MSPNITLLAVVAGLYATGVFLILERSLTRVLLGVLLLGNATNLLILSAGGPAGGAPIVGVTPAAEMSDPLTQAMILTAIVITMGMAAFLLSVIHRSWTLSQQDDDVVDDVEDRRVAGMRDLEDDTGDDSDSGDDDADGDATDGLLPDERGRT